MNKRVFAVASVAALLTLVGPAAAEDSKSVIERFEATAVQMDVGEMKVVQIAVMEWSTPEERKAMVEAFEQGGSEGLVKYLHGQSEKGFVQFPGSLGYQMRYAYQFEKDGKRTVVMGTDRPIRGLEIYTQSRSLDNNVSLLELELDAETGKGTGQMILGAELGVDKKTGHVKIETLGTQPIRFTSVREKKAKNKK